MKKFLFKSVLISIPLFIIIFVNLIIDNAYIFKNESIYQKFGKYLAEGKNISNLYNYNEFLTRKYAIEQMKEPIDFVCLGSSRVMQLNDSIFGDEKFFNMGVSALSINELIASYNVLLENNINPKVLIIGIDPSFFLRKKSKLREDFYKDYINYTNKIELKSPVHVTKSKDKFLQLLSPIYFYNNLKFGKKEYALTKKIFIEEPVVCSDGSYVYSQDKRNQNENQILENAVRQYDSFFLKRFRDMSIDLELKQLFETFVLDVNTRHKLIFFLAPYHPFLSEKFDHSELSGIMEFENYLVQFTKNNNCDIIGSFDSRNYQPQLVGLNFYDGVHAKRETVSSIFSKFLKDN